MVVLVMVVWSRVEWSVLLLVGLLVVLFHGCVSDGSVCVRAYICMLGCVIYHLGNVIFLMWV